MKGKAQRSKTKLGLPVVILICSLFFLAGFFFSTLLSQVFLSSQGYRDVSNVAYLSSIITCSIIPGTVGFLTALTGCA